MRQIVLHSRCQIRCGFASMGIVATVMLATVLASVPLAAFAEKPFSRALEYSIVSCTSAQSERGANSANNAVDGDPKTIWHTAFRPDVSEHPHEIVVDLGQATAATGFFYTPRPEGLNGTIQRYAVYLSDTTTDWGEPAAKGAFFGAGVKEYAQRRVAFEMPNTGRYLRLVSLSAVNGEPFTSAAEIGVFTGEFVPTPQPVSRVICLRCTVRKTIS